MELLRQWIQFKNSTINFPRQKHYCSIGDNVSQFHLKWIFAKSYNASTEKQILLSKMRSRF